jgi:hypothetical protein
MSVFRLLRAATVTAGVVVTPLLLATGCGPGGPEVAPVTGTVTLDGHPLDGALVEFTPRAGGRPSYGRTDDEGRYTLRYTDDRKGALPGEHTVRITTYLRSNPDDGVIGRPELVPARYNTKSELTRTVEPKKNVLDFELDGKGKVERPEG